MGGRHDAPLLHRVVEQGQGGKGQSFDVVAETIKKTAFRVTRMGQLVAQEDIDGGTDKIRHRQGLGNGGDELLVRRGGPLLDPPCWRKRAGREICPSAPSGRISSTLCTGFEGRNMINQNEILETVHMIDQQHLDIRTITMGISLLDCADPDCKSTRAEKPPIKLTPVVLAALSMATAKGT